MSREQIIADVKKIGFFPVNIKKKVEAKVIVKKSIKSIKSIKSTKSIKYSQMEKPSLEGLRTQLLEAIARQDKLSIEVIKDQLLHFSTVRDE